MKKVFNLILVFIVLFTFSGCNKNSFNKKVQKEEMGQGTISIVLPKNNFDKNNPSIVLLDDNTPLNMGLTTERFDDSKDSYILLDNKEIQKTKLGYNKSVIDLSSNLPKDALKVGKHKLEVIQYNNNNKEDNIVVYKFINYECKKK